MRYAVLTAVVVLTGGWVGPVRGAESGQARIAFAAGRSEPVARFAADMLLELRMAGGYRWEQVPFPGVSERGIPPERMRQVAAASHLDTIVWVERAAEDRMVVNIMTVASDRSALYAVDLDAASTPADAAVAVLDLLHRIEAEPGAVPGRDRRHSPQQASAQRSGRASRSSQRRPHTALGAGMGWELASAHPAASLFAPAVQGCRMGAGHWGMCAAVQLPWKRGWAVKEGKVTLLYLRAEWLLVGQWRRGPIAGGWTAGGGPAWQRVHMSVQGASVHRAWYGNAGAVAAAWLQWFPADRWSFFVAAGARLWLRTVVFRTDADEDPWWRTPRVSPVALAAVMVRL